MVEKTKAVLNPGRLCFYPCGGTGGPAFIRVSLPFLHIALLCGTIQGGRKPVVNPCKWPHYSGQEESTWSDLSRVRDGWQEVEAEERRLLSQMSIQDSLRQLLALQRAFEPHLQQTEALFRAERLAYLEELQRRLAQLDE